MGMFSSYVAFHFFQHGVTERSFGQHTLDGFFQNALRMFLLQLAEGGFMNAAGVTRMTIILFVFGLVPCHTELFDVDNDDIVARIDVWGVNRFVLATQPVGNFGGHTTEHLVGRINHEPVVGHFMRLGGKGFHYELRFRGKPRILCEFSKAVSNLPQILKGVVMECIVRWHEGMSFIAQTGTGHLIAMDGAPEAGGHNWAPRPLELLLAGAGGCASFDVVLILKRARQEITGCEAKLTAERAESDPKVFTKIHFHFTVKGKNLKAEAVERAVKLSAEKYCSASIMLGKTAEMTHTWEIQEL